MAVLNCDVTTSAGWTVVALTAPLTVLLGLIVFRSTHARAVIEKSLEADVERLVNISYGPGGAAHLLDLYHSLRYAAVIDGIEEFTA